MTVRRPHAISLVAVAAAMLVAACGGSAATPAPPDGVVRVVATTTVLADMVRQVGGDRVSVESLVPKGGEVHTFDPTPSDVRRVTEADLVVLNGLGLDEWLAGLVADAGTGAPVVELAEDLEGVTLLEGGAHEDEEGEPGASEDAHSDEEFNPHLWLDVANGSRYAGRIAEALTAADPDGTDTYASRLADYQQRLADLDAYAGEQLGAVPAERRTVVSFHDAFPYFAAAYGLTIDGTIVDAPGQDPSAGEIASLVESIRANGVSAIFAEAQFSDDLVRTIGDETGATVISDLYTDSVGDAPADTYESMMRWNVDRVAEALAGS